ncbi:MarR family transcriptional regulator [Haloechinothrix sp. LS1_15]|uniref:MarR family winged helix-turn-helix transcriptional regulator n=1 Tax=Haloechinothrix sp. LS1_15 TaxID=2652248 RepID=UPI0029489D53|nr:MarR family transcriptional regulator [Haloechinothrix sp. LS1_15]MDV6012428.1 MarR family transcriptional regulator [Haloechinothrix sp. LS1_15]
MTARVGWQLAELLTRAEHEVSRRLGAALDAEGLTLPQWRVLALLADGSGHTMRDIAEHAMLPAATLTRVIDRLVEVNLIYRRGDIADRRRVLVYLSARGKNLYRNLAATLEREEEALTAALTEEDKARLAELLERLTAHRR